MANERPFSLRRLFVFTLIVMANEGSNDNAAHEPNYTYDVYLSFRGADTRHSFVDFFYYALQQRGLIVFRDDMDLQLGEDIWLALDKAIEESRILVVFISENYASSQWCLEELANMLESMKLKNRRLCPVFFGVDPLDVRHQRNRFGDAMAHHERRFGSDSEMVQKWRSALFEVTNLHNGWYFQANGKEYQHEFAQNIVDWITNNVVDRINRSFFSYDVFLSFSEQDTSYPFTDFLYNVLQREGFRTFRDDEKKEVKNKISQSRNAIIEESKFSIIVFSENYAYSSRCLDALVKILDCKKLNKQRVLSIFYKVPPSDVRYQSSHYSKAMDAHERELENESEKVKKWRTTLFEVANLKGWHFETGYEYKTIQMIVELVGKSLPRYDVFLSFRGRDTRHTFTGYLYYALCKKGFKTFMDDEALEGGDQMSETLINAIQESRFSIIVFSENYAYSSWCLDELVSILECKRMKNHLVWPIYYKVEPSDVWHQRNSYAKAMAVQENRYGKETKKVLKWRSALSEVANLKEWHFQSEYEYEFIEKIAEDIRNI